ncbi:uncharacterized protein [Temnothorax nylanderi]|uniref:uncharacterized protein isoform X3 n=1 Tax=Temnothorax nylanderi TaxID=102681 RepID=UPI003A860C69
MVSASFVLFNNPPFYFVPIENLYLFQYAVVTFLPNDKDTEPTSDVVPTCWLLAKNTKAYWPNFPKRGNTDKRSKLILSLAEPDKSWPTYDVKFCHGYDTYNKARKAANLQNDEDRTVGTEVSDIDQPRKRKKNPKYNVTESSESEYKCNTHTVKKSRKNKLRDQSSDSENEEMEEKAVRAKVAALLAKRNNRKPQVSQNKEVSMVTKSKNLIKTLDLEQNRSVGLNDTIGSDPRSKKTYNLTDVSHATTEAITPMSFPSTPASSPLQFHRQYDDRMNIDRMKEQLLLGNDLQQSESVLPSSPEIIQEESREKINAATDNKYGSINISQKLSQSSDLSDEQRKIITSVTDQPTGVKAVSSGKHSKENRSYDANCKNLLTKSVSPSSSKHQSSSDNTDAAIKIIKTELLQEISSKLDFVMMNTTKILTYLAPEESLLLRPDNLPALPLKSVDEYDKFEEFLNDGTNFSTVVQYFAGRMVSQGSDWQSAVYLVSKLLISNKLARAISWGGTKDTKIALANSKIMDAVSCTISR